MVKALIITEKADALIRKRRHGYDIFFKEVVARKLTVVFLTKDVRKFCADPLFDGKKIKFRNLCLFKAYSGKTIASHEVSEVISKIKAASDEAVMVSSDQKDYSAARRNGVQFVHYGRYGENNPMVKKPFKCLDRIEFLFEILEH